MTMFIPNHQSVSKSITKSGIDIDAVVRNNLSHVVKNNLSLSKLTKKSLQCLSRGGYGNSMGPVKTESAPSPTVAATDGAKVTPLPARYEVNANLASTPLQQQRKQRRNSIATSSGKKILISGRNLKKENSEGSNDTTSPDILDDSLTSLKWLTDVKINDLMDGKPISYTPLSPAPSNCSDEGVDDKRLGRVRYYSDSPVDYRTNNQVKPPYSYAALIIMAMKSRSCAKMTLSEIYKWITENFVFYKHAEPSWQNSIRHNLSLNKCFAKIPRNKGDPGKGGYWSIVPEYADKLLESNIRKRQSSMLDYGCQEFVKRQRLDLFESQLLLNIKDGLRSQTQLLVKHTNSSNSSDSVFDLNDNEVHASDTNTSKWPRKNTYKHTLTQQQPMTTLADAEQCRIDHPYGKDPFSRFVTDEENIRMIADNLQRTATHSFGDTSVVSNNDTDNNNANTAVTSMNFELSNSLILNTFSNAIRTDCIWSSEQNLGASSNSTDLLTGSMSMVKEELLEARNLTADFTDNATLLAKGLISSLNSSGGLTATFCLSPPLSGDDDTLSDDLNDDTAPFEELDLTVRGTSMTLLNPTHEMIGQEVKEEPLSPESIDLQNDKEE